MTNALRDALTDLADGVAPYVVREDLGRTAWARGRRRRWRRRAVATVFALVTTAFVATSVFPGAVLVLPAGPAPELAPDEPGPRVDGFPQRIGHQWRITSLPERPGPLAALMQTATGWYAVSPTGVRWHLDVDDHRFPTLSPNGRYLGYLESADGPYVIQDLVTGARKVFPAVGVSDPAPYQLPDAGPSFWSPDARHLALRATQPARAATGVLVLSVDGSEYFGSDEFVAGTDRLLAGWADPNTTVWLRGGIAEFDWLYGPTARVVELHGTGPVAGMGEWDVAVSPDGQELLVLQPGPFPTLIQRFSLVSGDPVGDRASVSDVVSHCPVAWAGPDVALSTTPGPEVTTVLVTSGDPRPLAVVEPGLGSRCLAWASGALGGTPHGAVWGTSQAWIGWWWREAVAVSLLVAAAIWYVVWLRRRRLSTKDRR